MFLLLDSEEALYGGAVGGGKTAALLMGALQYVDVPGYAALILRRTFPELEQPEGPIWQSTRWFGQVPETIRPKYLKTEHQWEFPSGAVIRFGHLDSADAILRYQGGGYQYVAFDELTHFEEEAYEFIGLSRQRRPPAGPLSEVPMRIRASANPGGPGHAWVKRRFIDKREPTVAFVPAKVWDNPGIDTDDYVNRLRKLNPVLQQQLLDGDWGAFEGAAFPMFNQRVHVVESFPLTDWFDRIEGMDYGLNGTAWHLLATDFDENLIFADMLYEEELLPDEVALRILNRRASGWGPGNVAYADPAIWHRTGSRNQWGRPAVLADEFADNGVPLVKANNDPRAGLIRLRLLMQPDRTHRYPAWHPRAGEYGSPRLFVARRCAELIDQFQGAVLQPIDKPDGGEKIDPEWESRHGHAVAAARYTVMAKPAPSVEPDPFHGVPDQLNPLWLDTERQAAELRREALDLMHQRAEHGAARRRTIRL